MVNDGLLDGVPWGHLVPLQGEQHQLTKDPDGFSTSKDFHICPI